jgi:hypothetical protein
MNTHPPTQFTLIVDTYKQHDHFAHCIIPSRIYPVLLLYTFIEKLCFKKLFGDVNIFSIVLSKNDNFFKCFTIFIFYEIHWGGWSSPSSFEEPPLIADIYPGSDLWGCLRIYKMFTITEPCRALPIRDTRLYWCSTGLSVLHFTDG